MRKGKWDLENWQRESGEFELTKGNHKGLRCLLGEWLKERRNKWKRFCNKKRWVKCILSTWFGCLESSSPKSNCKVRDSKSIADDHFYFRKQFIMIACHLCKCNEEDNLVGVKRSWKKEGEKKDEIENMKNHFPQWIRMNNRIEQKVDPDEGCGLVRFREHSLCI